MPVLVVNLPLLSGMLSKIKQFFSGQNSLKRILQLSLPQRGMLVTAIALTVAQSVLTAYQPYLYQHTIDGFIVTKNLVGLRGWCLLILGVLVLQSALGFVNAYLSEIIGQNVILKLRSYVYNHLTGLRLSFFDKTPVGTTVTRTISDIETIADLFASGIITICGDLIQIILILILMFWMNWQLAFLSLAILPFLIIAANKFRKGVRDSFQEVRSNVTRLNAFIQEHITGMQVVQLFNRENDEFNKFKHINNDHRKANIRSIFFYAIFFPTVELIVALAFAILVSYGSWAMFKHKINIGELTAFIMFINLFFRPVRVIADRFNNIQMGMVAAERIFNLTDDVSQKEFYGDKVANNIKGHIKFENVWFSYDDENYVIKDLSFELDPGKTLAVVGHTGSGKTTLINLISGFYVPQKGRILIDDIPLEEYNIPELRKKIAVVLQDVFLFSNSIEENIRLQNPLISHEKIVATAQYLGASDFIEQLPGKYQYNVMERGLTLSLGQRQLISFIRALSSDPAILILDEATSSIDSKTEELIQDAIPRMIQNRTSIVIAHRLSTIRYAHQILVMDKGVLAEAGNHESLISHGGIYAALWAEMEKTID